MDDMWKKYVVTVVVTETRETTQEHYVRAMDECQAAEYASYAALSKQITVQGPTLNISSDAQVIRTKELKE